MSSETARRPVPLGDAGLFHDRAYIDGAWVDAD